MEKRIQKKVDEYMKQFKESIKEQITDKNLDPELYSDILQLIYDYPSMEITQEDLKKRKRIKNTVPLQ